MEDLFAANPRNLKLPTNRPGIASGLLVIRQNQVIGVPLRLSSSTDSELPLAVLAREPKWNALTGKSPLSRRQTIRRATLLVGLFLLVTPLAVAQTKISGTAQCAKYT